MDISAVFLDIIWSITKIFFLLSILLLLFFLATKKLFDFKRIAIREKLFQFMFSSMDRNIHLKDTIEVIAYGEMIGQRLLSTTEYAQRHRIKLFIYDINLFNKFKILYEKTKFLHVKIYMFSRLILFSDTRVRVLCFDILNQSQKKIAPEFTILALFGLALCTEKKDDLEILHKILTTIDKEGFFMQKFSEFFFAYAYISLHENQILDFIETFEIKNLSYIDYALIYAFRSISSSEKIYYALLARHKKYPDDDFFTISLIQLQFAWNIQEKYLILKFHDSKNHLLRIACARVGLSVLDESNYSLLIHYLYDENVYVRKNFLLALSLLKIPLHTIQFWLQEKDSNYQDNVLLTQSLELYEKGVF